MLNSGNDGQTAQSVLTFPFYLSSSRAKIRFPFPSGSLLFRHERNLLNFLPHPDQHAQPRRSRNARPARLAGLRQTILRRDFFRRLRQLRGGAQQGRRPAPHARRARDEIAMVVNYIDEGGYIYVRKMGGIDAASPRRSASSSTRAAARSKASSATSRRI